MSIQNKVMEAVKDKLKKEPHNRRKEVFYASEAGYCPRKIYYSFLEHKPMEDLYGIFEMGEIVHEFIQNLFDTSGIYPQVELERNVMLWTPEFNISGRIDIYGIRENGDRDVWEVKSASAKSFAYTERVNKPNDIHVAQLQLYLLAERVDKGYLLYVNKNNLDIKIFEVKKDEKLINDILSKFKYIQECIDKKIPPKATKRETWQCKSCPYAVECELYDKENNKIGKGTEARTAVKGNAVPIKEKKLPSNS